MGSIDTNLLNKIKMANLEEVFETIRRGPLLPISPMLAFIAYFSRCGNAQGMYKCPACDRSKER